MVSADIKNKIEQDLLELRDEGYKAFCSGLMPTVSPQRVIGVRTPLLRKMAKGMSIAEQSEANAFINDLPHKYYEQDNLHALLICKEKDFNKCIELIEQFLPYIDNWATCDMLRPKALGKNKPELLKRILHWLESPHEYTVRFGIGMLMCHFLDENFNEAHLALVASVRCGEYYIDMMVAWYFATALAKQRESTIRAMEQKILSPWRHNKAIAKAVESYRISESDKTYLRTLKV